MGSRWSFTASFKPNSLLWIELCGVLLFRNLSDIWLKRWLLSNLMPCSPVIINSSLMRVPELKRRRFQIAAYARYTGLLSSITIAAFSVVLDLRSSSNLYTVGEDQDHQIIAVIDVLIDLTRSHIRKASGRTPCQKSILDALYGTRHSVRLKIVRRRCQASSQTRLPPNSQHISHLTHLPAAVLWNSIAAYARLY